MVRTNAASGTSARATRGEWQPTPVTPADFRLDRGVPVSVGFDDVYFSRDGGLNETRHVFLSGNQLAERFARLAPGELFVVAELGFGTGLNFLATWDLWRKVNPRGASLRYYSFERFPCTAEQIASVHVDTSELAALARSLCLALPEVVTGMHRLLLDDQSVSPVLVYGEASEFLPLVEVTVDAWFFDGFNPKKNPELWQPALFDEIARTLKPGSTCATYSVAKQVREVISASGFSVRKQSGFGKKREMLVGAVPESVVSSEPNRPTCESSAASHALPKVVAVIGAGLAGCSLAYSLSRRGCKVIVLESADAIATQASGNPVAVVMPHLSVKPDFLSRLYVSGFLFSLALFRHLAARSDQTLFHQCGVIRLATNKRLENVAARLAEQQLPQAVARAVSAAEASQLAGVSVDQHGLYFALGGWVHPETLCAELLRQSEGVELRLRSTVTQLAPLKVDASSGSPCGSPCGPRWSVQLAGAESQLEVDAVVVANGTEAHRLCNFDWLPLEPVRGQLAYLRTSKQLAGVKSVLCYDGFVLPAINGEHVVGATYDRQNFNPEPDPESQRVLCERITDWAPQIVVGSDDVVGARVGFRTMSPDRMPLIGAAPEREGFVEHYRAANSGRFGEVYPERANVAGLYFSLGHGSRGLLSCPLAAEIIADQVCGLPAAAECDLLRAVTPSRFLVRAVKRRSHEGATE